MSNSLAIEKVTVRYADNIAVDAVSLDLACGKIHALLGENGAGKSSLLRALAGVHAPDSGRIFFAGGRQKMGLMRQDAGLIAGMSVIENLALACGGNRWRINWRQLRLRAVQALARQQANIDLDCAVEKLGFGQRQQVALAGLDLSGCQFLLLDEPVAALTPVEADAFLAGIRQQVDQGASALIASHRIAEILAVADHVHVLRAGRLVFSGAASSTDAEQIRQAIFAQSAAARLPSRPSAMPGATILYIDDLVLPGFAGQINLQVAAGEMIGIAGMAGNGQNQLIEILAGFSLARTGTIRIAGKHLAGGNGRKLGMRCIVEDPLADACMADMSIAENLVVHDYRRPPYASRFAILQGRAIAAHANQVIARARLAVQRSSDLFCWLSGGNQRKLLVERELAGNPAVVVALNPTAGLDSASAASVVECLDQACQRGAAILICSEDLDVLSERADRLMVMSAGKLQEVSGPDRRRLAIELMCAGASTQAPESSQPTTASSLLSG